MATLDPSAYLADIRHWTDELAAASHERATASSAFRREWSRMWSQLVKDQGKSATEASKWADAGTVVLKAEVDKLDAEITRCQAELAYHRDCLAVSLHTSSAMRSE
jgi:hypothetical protein